MSGTGSSFSSGVRGGGVSFGFSRCFSAVATMVRDIWFYE